MKERTKPLFGEKILIGPSTFATVDKQPMEILIAAGAEVIDNPYKRKLAMPELMELLSKGVTGLIAGLELLDRDVMVKSSLKVISRCGSGISNIDMEAAGELGITVCSTPDAPIDSVAELALGAMLSLLRMIPFMDNELHKRRWTKRTGMLLKGKTVAIIGFGKIGRRLHELLIPFKVKALAVDPFLKEKFKGVTLLSLEEALPQADIISIHADGERCIIGNKELSMVKPDVLLLNAARGPLVDEDALIEALDENRVAGAWLDVFKEEPYDGPLTKYPQVILTPHVGSYTFECRKRMETEAVKNLIDAFKKRRTEQ